MFEVLQTVTFNICNILYCCVLISVSVWSWKWTRKKILWFNCDVFVYQCDTCSVVLANSMSTWHRSSHWRRRNLSWKNASLITGCRHVVLGSVRKQSEPMMKINPVSSTPPHPLHGLTQHQLLPPCSCPVWVSALNSFKNEHWYRIIQRCFRQRCFILAIAALKHIESFYTSKFPFFSKVIKDKIILHCNNHHIKTRWLTLHFTGLLLSPVFSKLHKTIIFTLITRKSNKA